MAADSILEGNRTWAVKRLLKAALEFLEDWGSSLGRDNDWSRGREGSARLHQIVSPFRRPLSLLLYLSLFIFFSHQLYWFCSRGCCFIFNHVSPLSIYSSRQLLEPCSKAAPLRQHLEPCSKAALSINFLSPIRRQLPLRQRLEPCSKAAPTLTRRLASSRSETTQKY